MVKLKNPLISLKASGRLGKGLTFLRRNSQDIAEKYPYPKDAQTSAQLAWRTMYQLAVDLWHALSAAEKKEWEAAGTTRHMTGYAWFISQALRPNPGLYLPLLGGTMQGAIQMDGQHIHGLPLPVHVNDVWRRQDFQDFCLPYHLTQGARVYHDAVQEIAHNTFTALAFNQERYDTDVIHDNVVSNSRLTCKTAGKYIIVANICWEFHAVGDRAVYIHLDGATRIAAIFQEASANNPIWQCVSTIYDLAVGQYVEVAVLHTAGVALDILVLGNYSPEFQMQRIG